MGSLLYTRRNRGDLTEVRLACNIVDKLAREMPVVCKFLSTWSRKELTLDSTVSPLSSSSATGVQPFGLKTPIIVQVSLPSQVTNNLSIPTFSASSPTERNSGAPIPPLQLSPFPPS